MAGEGGGDIENEKNGFRHGGGKARFCFAPRCGLYLSGLNHIYEFYSMKVQENVQHGIGSFAYKLILTSFSARYRGRV